MVQGWRVSVTVYNTSTTTVVRNAVWLALRCGNVFCLYIVGLRHRTIARVPFRARPARRSVCLSLQRVLLQQLHNLIDVL